MNRLEFYKYYYNTTMKYFPEDGIRVIRKKDRLFLTILYYLLMFLPWLLLLIEVVFTIFIFIIIFDILLLCCIDIVLDANIFKIERFYRAYKKNNIYSKEVIYIFNKDIYSLVKKYLSNIKGLKLNYITDNTNYSNYKFTIKYFGEGAKFIIKPNRVIVKYKEECKTFDSDYLSIKDLFCDIREYLLSLQV